MYYLAVHWGDVSVGILDLDPLEGILPHSPGRGQNEALEARRFFVSHGKAEGRIVVVQSVLDVPNASIVLEKSANKNQQRSRGSRSSRQ